MVHHIPWEGRVLVTVLLYDPALDLIWVISTYMFFLIQLDHHFLLQKPFSLPDQRCDHALLFFPVKSLTDLHLAAISIQVDHCSSCSSDSIILRSQKGFPSLHNQLECRLARKIVLSYIQLLDQPYHMGSLWICFLPTALLLCLRSLSLLLPQ